MRKNKNLKYMLLCAGLLAALTGCGTDKEESSVAETSLGISSAFEADAELESDTDNANQQETKSTKKSEKETDQQSETEDTSVTSAVAETSNPETSADTSAQTTVSVTEAQSTDAETMVSDDQNQNPETPQEDPPQQDPVTPDVPQQVPDAPPEVTPDPEPDVTEPDVTDPPAIPDTLTVTYQGNVITIGEDVTEFKNAVKPNSEASAPSCMGDGEDIVYSYDDLTIYVWGNAGSLLVTGVDVMSPGIAPVQGYDINSAADFTGDKVIDCGDGYKIILTEAGGQVINISYNKDF